MGQATEKNSGMRPTAEGKPLAHVEKHFHPGVPRLERETEKTTVALVGNPNVGKSVVFNYLSGLYVDVSNYPGTTVEINRGVFENYVVYDTPGVYGISSFSDEESVTRDIVLDADLVIDVVDATHLERDLFLTQQLVDMGKKMIVVLNFMDEVKRQKVEINVERLQHFLGVKVIPTIAVRKVGLDELKQSLPDAREGTQREELHSLLHTMLSRVGSQAEALLVLEGDPYVAARHGISPGTHQERIYIDRRNRVNYIVNHVVVDHATSMQLSGLLGRWAMKPLTGVPMLLTSLYLLYLLVGKFVAQDIVDLTENQLGKGIWEPWLRSAIVSLMSWPPWLEALLVGEFGVLTMTTTYLLFLLLPLVIGFYVALALLEDSGYLPRLATLVDRLLNFLGLNGRAVIPLILGFGCVTSATITTRLLGSEREKTIATTILQFAIPCSAQLAVIAALLAGAGFAPLVVYVSVILAVLISIGTLLNRLMKGESAPLLIDLPPMRLPRFRNVARKTSVRTYQFMKEATPWFFVGALVVGMLQITGLLDAWQRALMPVTTRWLQLPPEAATAFVMGIVRRDFGAAGLYSMMFSPMQIVVALVTITLFVPCVASLMVMLKERGVKQGVLIWAGTWIVAFAVGGIVSHILI